MKQESEGCRTAGWARNGEPGTNKGINDLVGFWIGAQEENERTVEAIFGF